jgi:predicted nucleotidyltransferase
MPLEIEGVHPTDSNHKQSGSRPLPAFTYFVDDQGYIYYSRGDNDLLADSVTAILVYIPVQSGSSNRYRPASGKSYIKYVVDGFTKELPNIRRDLSTRCVSLIEGKMRQSATGDEFLSVPTANIVEVFKPQQALNDILAGQTSDLSENSVQKVRAAVKLLTDQGIASERLGLYGGLQCGLRSPSGDINDIDILVEGCNAYPSIVRLASKMGINAASILTEIQLAPAARLRRRQLSAVFLPEYPDTIVDIKISYGTAGHQKLTTFLANAQVISDTGHIEAEVIDASHSLCLPAQYLIRKADGTEVWIATNRYIDTGAAAVGDTVRINGAMTSQGVIVLTDPLRHYIYDSWLDTLLNRTRK